MKHKNQQRIREGLSDLAAKAEYDHEVQMARSELYKISKYAVKLHDLLKNISEKQGLEAWQQSYITKAADYMDNVYHSIDYQENMQDPVAEAFGDDIMKSAQRVTPNAKKRKSPDEQKKDRDEMMRKRDKDKKPGDPKKASKMSNPDTVSSPQKYYQSKKPGSYTGDSVNYTSQLNKKLSENIRKRLR